MIRRILAMAAVGVAAFLPGLASAQVRGEITPLARARRAAQSARPCATTTILWPSVQAAAPG